MDVETSKNLGGIGAILIALGPLGFFGTPYAGLLSLIGVILVLIAMKGLSDHYNEAGIFNNILYGFVTTIVGFVVTVGVVVSSFLMSLSDLGINDWTDATEWTGAIQEGFMDFSVLINFIVAVILAVVVLFVFLVISSILYRKSFNTLAEKSGVGMFSTVGLLMLIGAILTIVAIGLVLIWVAIILLAVGFFSIKRTPTQPPPPAPEPTAAPSPSS
ncbi:MAG: DUF996 domain-containing protein [Candidatus Bathyarchaeota archaeon]|nr:DUF996 domain-containing protein [Candidatus Bathyarchaeota archaeon]